MNVSHETKAPVWALLFFVQGRNAAVAVLSGSINKRGGDLQGSYLEKKEIRREVERSEEGSISMVREDGEPKKPGHGGVIGGGAERVTRTFCRTLQRRAQAKRKHRTFGTVKLYRGTLRKKHRAGKRVGRTAREEERR